MGSKQFIVNYILSLVECLRKKKVAKMLQEFTNKIRKCLKWAIAFEVSLKIISSTNRAGKSERCIYDHVKYIWWDFFPKIVNA